MSGHDRRHNRNAVTGLRESQQRVGGTAFECNIWLELCDAAGSIKRGAHGEAGVKEQKRTRSELANVHSCVINELKSTIAGRNKLQRRQPNCLERIIAGLNRSRRTD